MQDLESYLQVYEILKGLSLAFDDRVGRSVKLTETLSSLENLCPLPEVKSICANAKSCMPEIEIHSDAAAPLYRKNFSEWCNTIRFQMSAVFMLRVMQSEGGASLDNIVTSLPEFHAVTHTHGDLVFSSIDGTVVVLFPRTTASTDPSRLNMGLLAIYDQTAHSGQWLIDFSAVDWLPIGILGNLLGYQTQLKRYGSQMHFMWLRPSALPPKAEQSCVGHFNLVLRAGHYFSKFTPNINPSLISFDKK